MSHKVKLYLLTVLALFVVFKCASAQDGEPSSDVKSFRVHVTGPIAKSGHPNMRFVGQSYILKGRDKVGVAPAIKGSDIDEKPYKKSRDLTLDFDDEQQDGVKYHLLVFCHNKFRGWDNGITVNYIELGAPQSGSDVYVTYQLEDQGTLTSSWAISGYEVTEVSLRTDKALKSVDVKESPAFSVAVGATEIKKDEYTVKHSVGVTNTLRGEVSLGVNWDLIEAGIKAGVERTHSSFTEESRTSSREVVVSGNGRKYKLVWVEYFQTGDVTTRTKDKEFTVPFEARVDWDLQLREVTK